MNQNGLRHRIETLARTGRSAGAIARILAAEGFQDGASRASVGRVLAELRGPVRSARVTQAAQRAQPTPVSQAPAAETAEPEPYVPDDEATARHAEAIAEFIDRRVDEAVAAELADAESLKDRWQNRAGAAGWPVCSNCGLHMPPKGAQS